MQHDKLLETAKGLQKCCKESRNENERQQEELKRILRQTSFPSSVSSFDIKPFWIRANVDSPGDMSWHCFGERSKYRTVMVYDRRGSSLETRDRQTLEGESSVIYSRMPSQRCNIVHVFVECMSMVPTGSSQNFRVSTIARPPPGFVPYCTIHLKRLSWGTRIKVWSGQIKWLYILRDLEAKKELAST